MWDRPLLPPAQEVATEPGARPPLARSGACAAVVDGGQALLMFGGCAQRKGQPHIGMRATEPCGDSRAAAAVHISPLLFTCRYIEDPRVAPPSREPTNEVWVFRPPEGSWRPLAAGGEATPQPRIVSQAVAVGRQVG